MIAIYARVSTEDQLKGYSIEGQIEDCKRLIGTIEYLEYIDEGITGEIINRPALMKLQEDIERGLITKVVCYDPDRLSRKLSVQLLLTEHFQKYNVELQFVKHEYKNDAEGQLFFQVRGAFSEFDKAKIKHNTMTGRFRKAKAGKVVKNSNLYGYDYDKKENGYVINKEEAKVVKMIFDYYTNPNYKQFYGKINGIALYLTGRYPTAKGGETWHRNVVRQMLTNSAYCGEYIQNRYDTVGNYVKKQSGEKAELKIRPKEEWLISRIPAIISKEQFNYAQALITKGKRRQESFSKHNYFLSGLVRCGRCGCVMNGRRKLSHGKDFYVYSCRKNSSGEHKKGCGKEVGENKLNRIVWERLLEILNNPDKLNNLEKDTTANYVQDEINNLEKEIEKTKKGRKKLFKLVSLSEDDDDFDLEEIKEEIRDLQLKEKELTNKYNQLMNEIKEEELKEPNESAISLLFDLFVSKQGQEFTFEEKQNMVRIAVKEVTVVDSDSFHIQIY